MRLLLLSSLLLLLTGCRFFADPAPASTATPASPTARSADNTLAERTAPGEPTDSPPTITPLAGSQVTPVAATTGPAELPVDWTRLSWQGLSIPIPPNAQWQPASETGITLHAVPVIAAGRVALAGGAHHAGPFFALLAYAGGPDDWLELERNDATSAAGNSVDEATIVEIQVAGYPARRYQRAVSGSATMGYYAVDLPADRLLFVIIEDIESRLVRQILDGLALE